MDSIYPLTHLPGQYGACFYWNTRKVSFLMRCLVTIYHKYTHFCQHILLLLSAREEALGRQHDADQTLFFLSHLHAQDDNQHIITTKITLKLYRNFSWFVITAVQDGVHIISPAGIRVVVRMKNSQNNKITGLLTDILQSYISFLLFL